MANRHSLYNDIEQFIETNDQQTIDEFIHWFQIRMKLNENHLSPQSSSHQDLSSITEEKSMINTSQMFTCSCGHRYSLRFSIVNLFNGETLMENKGQETIHLSPCKRLKRWSCSPSKLLICTHCQIRLHTRETYLQHYSMHQQGYSFCKRCFQFHHGQHQCTQDKSDLSRLLLNNEKKFDELHSLEQLIPPETVEQTDGNTTNIIDQETSTTARLTRFGLPTLTDSVVEVIQPDGKRQFRCPLCLNSYVNRSGLNRHYITHSSQDLWKVGQYLSLFNIEKNFHSECQFCGKRYSRKDSLKHHMKTQHAEYLWNDKYSALSNETFEIDPSNSSISNGKQVKTSEEIVLMT